MITAVSHNVYHPIPGDNKYYTTILLIAHISIVLYPLLTNKCNLLECVSEFRIFNTLFTRRLQIVDSWQYNIVTARIILLYSTKSFIF